MFIIRLFRWFCGYVRFTVTGDFIERFLNLAMRGGVNIWELHREENRVTGCVLLRDYKRFRLFTRKTGVRVRHTGVAGLPFVGKKYRKRVGLLLGVVAFFVALFVLSQFIWQINVNGCETVDPQTILDAVQEYGLKEGVFRGSVDAREIENRVMIKLDTLSWIAINIQGSTANIEIEERVKPPEMLPLDDPCNVVAGHEGMIVRVEAHDGKAMVEKGDAVQKGELLISGIIESKSGKNIVKHAWGKVIALYDETMTIRVPLKQRQKVLSNEKKERGFLRVGPVEIPLSLGSSPGENAQVRIEERQLSLFGFALPIHHGQRVYQDFSYEEVTLSQSQAKAQALARLEELEEKGVGDCEKKDRTLSGEIDGEYYILTARFVVEKDIGVTEKILTDRAKEGENLQ
ncbi:sporulation protein YqfD [Zongyangia hominis]|uniref:Sporulation protein YqfD n=1 Tax=Zongyangia hominis TaxID=2763677 RepID=A0A926EBJ1_9FIRM|nr:sporulation protein YqfD [Zongyangia hominis]MBC8570862.1 sporulation protein YqfD [Zongyangia hominis]